MTRLLRSVLLATLTLSALPALADELPRYQLQPPALTQLDEGGGAGHMGGPGSLLAGRTVGAGADAMLVQFGWPGLSFTYLHGSSANLDFGGSFTFNYGFEGTTHTSPGLKFAGIVRLNLLDTGKINLGLRFDPGITMYFGNHYYWRDNTVAFGISTPIQLAIGVEAGDAMMINFGIDMPMCIFFTPDVVFEMPILTGIGLEYHVDPRLSITLNTGFGPDVFIGNGGSDTQFAFKTLAGIGYRF